MRDHPEHLVPLLGAGWGARITDPKIRSKWTSTWNRILKERETYSDRAMKGPDQGVLESCVWPWGKKSVLQHDSYTCSYFPGSIGFPTERKDNDYNFIAAVGDMKIWEECPESCRRKQKWKYC